MSNGIDMGNTVGENNKRIAKNTIVLYARMLVMMCVTLYTSRVIFQALGAEDYGVYNVVAGVVTMFSFINSTLATGTQRFLTFALGEGNTDKQTITFTTAFFVHLVLALIMGIIIAVAGFWLLENHLVIPDGKMQAARWVLVCSALTLVLNITQVPYMSSIIAHENMSIYAYMSIFDAVAKLSVAFLIKNTDAGRLELYAVLLLVVSIIDIIVYRIYCMRKYDECRVKKTFDRTLLKSMLTFSGWNIVGCAASTGSNQGVSIVLNVFFGPIVNAARGIAMQVNSAVMQFVGSFQTAVTPQIVKYFAAKDTEKMNDLIINNARYAGLLMLLPFVPLYIEMDFVLRLWLGDIPDDTVFMTRIILIQSFIQAVGRPVIMGIHAVGKMKWANILAGSCLLLILPLSYVCLKVGLSLHIVLIIMLIPWLGETFIDAIILKRYVGFDIITFYVKSYGATILITLAAFVLPVSLYLLMDAGWERFLAVLVCSLLWISILIYRFGITPSVRQIIKNKIRNFHHA